MIDLIYWIGVSLAICAGVINYSGTILQKKVVNELPSELKIMRSLIRNKTWVFGFLLGFVVSSIFFMIAQLLIGPTLIPGLMNSGLIILALGSIYILGEDLQKKEIFGIVVMIIAVFLLGISRFSINISESNIVEFSFLVRLFIFTFSLLFFSFLFHLLQRSNKRYRGICLSLFSGNMFALSNLWVSILIGTIGKVFDGSFIILELFLFLFSTLILITSNIYGVTTIQKAFTISQASNSILIQQIPIQITPVFIYFLIFMLEPPNYISI
ncbi:MAG: hypothetical protein GF317_00735, partial [Candidatus Lokiarchaeota archaeon]|nr:hypothetical protein [Candidatus Lokiarchaeota archaeon]